MGRVPEGGMTMELYLIVIGVALVLLGVTLTPIAFVIFGDEMPDWIGPQLIVALVGLGSTLTLGAAIWIGAQL